MAKRHPRFYDPEWRFQHASEYRVSFVEQCRSLTVLRNEIRTEYQQIGSHVLQNVLHRVEKAFQGFFRRVAGGQTPGYPRYHSYKRYESFCFPDQSSWKLKENRLSIPGIGTIKVKMHRNVQGTIKTCTIKREGEHWYVVLACEVQAQPHVPYTNLAVGIDMGLLVNPKDTSQICSGYGKKGKHKDLSERTHICTHCGLVLDRDQNAALNTLKRGEQRLGLD